MCGKTETTSSVLGYCRRRRHRRRRLDILGYCRRRRRRGFDHRGSSSPITDGQLRKHWHHADVPLLVFEAVQCSPDIGNKVHPTDGVAPQATQSQPHNGQLNRPIVRTRGLDPLTTAKGKTTTSISSHRQSPNMPWTMQSARSR